MKGDFSRGSNPDRKRGKPYRRVLLQQRRLLLDSDLAAMSDAQDQLTRGVTRDVGGAAGSSDLGYLITPGKLQAVFEHLDRVRGEGPLVFHRDYSRKYLGRFPSLFLIHPGGAVGRAWIRLLAGLAPNYTTTLALWARADVATNLLVEAGNASITVPIPAGNAFQRVPFTINVPYPFDGQIALRMTPGSPGVWIGLIESHEDVDFAPYFWVAQGRYHVDGLTVANPAHQGYPEVSFPASAGFNVILPAPARFAAYLEVWERGITHIEDRGIREEALGGGQDTTVRTQAMGQVKLVPIGGMTAAQVRAAFASVQVATGTLDIEVQAVDSDPDPCALPLSGGYTGRDNRLYWFEVHTGGALGAAVLKWSRDNASELHAVQEISGSTIKLTRGTGLRDGDIVEVLSEVIDLGDASAAKIASNQLVPARRMVGDLALLLALPADEQGREQFRLVAVDNPVISVVPNDPVRYGASGERVSKVRRWHGLIRTQAATGADPHHTITLEDGILVTLRGSFEVGSYWQYEARRGQQNDNGAWQPAPHGPERSRALLAFISKPAVVTQPMVLEAWLDERYSPLPQLDADDIAYDGSVSETEAGTVQEALDEVYMLAGEGGVYTSAASWKDGSGVTNGITINDAINEIIADLAANPGSARIGAQGTTELAAGSIRSQLDDIATAWGKLNRAQTWSAKQTFNGASGDTNAALETTVAPATRKLLWEFNVGIHKARFYAASAGDAFEIAMNAAWNGSAWQQDNAQGNSARLRLSRNNLFIDRIGQASPPWTDSGWSAQGTTFSFGAPPMTTAQKAMSINPKSIVRAHGRMRSLGNGTKNMDTGYAAGYNSSPHTTISGNNFFVDFPAGGTLATDSYTVLIWSSRYTNIGNGAYVPKLQAQYTNGFEFYFVSTVSGFVLDPSSMMVAAHYIVFGD
jgi:hypothetical protein